MLQNIQWGQEISRSMWRRSGGGRYAKHASYGPFSVTTYDGAGSRRKRKPTTHKVVNKNGRRVHRGSLSSCMQVCENFNLKYAEWLMLQP